MPESSSHPGAEMAETADFSEYIPFIDIEGLDSTFAENFRANLEEFYNESQQSDFPPLWRPGSCARTKDHFYLAERAFAPQTLELWYNRDVHYWFQIPTGEKIVIVDPAGLPKDIKTIEDIKEFIKVRPAQPDFKSGLVAFDEEERRKMLEDNPSYQFRYAYQPYFGLINNAPDVHKSVYTRDDNFQVPRDRIYRYHERNYPLF